MISCITPAHLHGAPHAHLQPAVLLSLCRLNLCLRKEAYPKVLVGWARTILLRHVEGININASLSPCVPAGLLASYVCVSTAMVLAISAAQHRLTLQAHSITPLPDLGTGWIQRGLTSLLGRQQRWPTWLHRIG